MKHAFSYYVRMGKSKLGKGSGILILEMHGEILELSTNLQE